MAPMLTELYQHVTGIRAVAHSRLHCGSHRLEDHARVGFVVFAPPASAVREICCESHPIQHLDLPTALSNAHPHKTELISSNFSVGQPAKMAKRMDQQAKKKELEELR